MVNIHSTAIIEEGAVIADGVTIGPYCVIGKDVKIGKNTVLQSHVVVEGITEIGEDNEIYSFASIGKVNQDLKYHGEPTTTIIGNKNRIREFVTIHRGTEATGTTKVGDNNLIMAYVHVAHDVVIGNNCIFSNGVTFAGHIVVGDNVVIGGLTGLHQFVKVGDHAMVGGASAVTQDICPFVLAEGNRAVVRGLNNIGLRRRGFTDEDLSNLKKAYRLIFRQGLALKDAIAEIKKDLYKDKNVKTLVDFIASSERGVAR